MGRKDKLALSELRRQRQVHGISLTEMAARTNYQLHYLSAMENGKVPVSAAVRQAYAQVLGVEADVLACDRRIEMM